VRDWERVRPDSITAYQQPPSAAPPGRRIIILSLSNDSFISLLVRQPPFELGEASLHHLPLLGSCATANSLDAFTPKSVQAVHERQGLPPEEDKVRVWLLRGRIGHPIPRFTNAPQIYSHRSRVS
jgi:hypothetical protein